MPQSLKSRDELPWLYYPRSNSVRVINSHQGLVPRLLDTYAGAGAAYSLHPLANANTDLILVRRSSDNSEEAFTGTEISNGTLASFCGAGDGFVKSMYDLTGGGKTLTQSTAGNQPKIVSSGALITQNSLPSMMFSAASAQHLVTSATFSSSQPHFVFCVGRASNISANRKMYAFSIQSDFTIRPADLQLQNGVNLRASDTGTNFNLFTLDSDGASSNIYKNGALILNGNSGTNTISSSVLYLGTGNAGSNPLEGYISTFIFYPSDQASNRTGIEGMLNAYFGIY